MLDGIRTGKLDNDPKSEERCTQILASTYCSNSYLPHLLLFDAYLGVMTSFISDTNWQNWLDLMKKLVQQGFKALEAAGFIGVDTTLAGGKLSCCAPPLSKESLPTALVNINVCIFIMAYLSDSFIALSQMIRAERWLHEAWWGEPN